MSNVNKLEENSIVPSPSAKTPTKNLRFNNRVSKRDNKEFTGATPQDRRKRMNEQVIGYHYLVDTKISKWRRETTKK